jgi:hypothetical protein
VPPSGSGELAPLRGTQVVHQRHQFGMAEALVSEELAHMGPVFLFAVGVVVFAVGPTAGPGQLYGSARQSQLVPDSQFRREPALA